MNKMPDMRKKFRVIGTTPVRPDGLDKITGRAVFGDDINLPNMLHGKVLRSPHPHARIKSLDVSKALELDGVHAVLTGDDLPKVPDVWVQNGEAGKVDAQDISDNIMAKHTVFYDGHALAAVAAESGHIADEAIKLIEVDYEILPHVSSVKEAMAEGAPVLHKTFIPGNLVVPTFSALPNASRMELTHGDVEDAFSHCEAIVEQEFTTETVHQGYIESHVTTVNWDQNDQITIWTSTQGQFAIREQVAAVLQIPLSQIKVIPLEIGGGFGGKDQIYLDPLAAILSKKSGRPVKMAMARDEVLRATGPSSGTVIRVKFGADKNGKLLAADVTCAYETGAYPAGPVAAGVVTSVTRYNIPTYKLEGFDVLLNKPKIKPYRAPGAAQSHFASEQVIDALAKKLDIDPVEFRLINAAKEGDRLSLGFPYPNIGGTDVLQAVKEHPHYSAPLEGKYVGRGVGFGFWFGGAGSSSAQIMANADGTVQLSTGSPDLSGTRMTLAMQAAEALGIDAEDVKATIGDTETSGFSLQSVGSRTTFVTGLATLKAAEELLDQMTERAALIWDMDKEEVEFRSGVFFQKNDPQKAMPFKDLAGQLEETGGPISASSTITPEVFGLQTAAHIVDVEVDVETGKVNILRYTAVQDAGKAVHPDYVEGQIQGGTVQGIGWALNEEYFYDENGRLMNASLLDYRMPTSLDVPFIEPVIVEHPNTDHPYGIRGVGEVPIVPPPAAIANAIYDAIGIRMESLPMSPRNVFAAIAKQKPELLLNDELL